MNTNEIQMPRPAQIGNVLNDAFAAANAATDVIIARNQADKERERAEREAENAALDAATPSMSFAEAIAAMKAASEAPAPEASQAEVADTNEIIIANPLFPHHVEAVKANPELIEAYIPEILMEIRYSGAPGFVTASLRDDCTDDVVIEAHGDTEAEARGKLLGAVAALQSIKTSALG